MPFSGAHVGQRLYALVYRKKVDDQMPCEIPDSQMAL